MLKSYKYRIYPTQSQIKMIEHNFSVCRLVYNLGLEIKIRAWQSRRKSISVFDLGKQLSDLKIEYPFISEAISGALYGSLHDLDRAFSTFFKGGGFPKFKSKKRYPQSFHFHNNKREIDWNNCTLTASKIANIPIVLSRKFDGHIKTITISKTATGKYFTSILVDDGNAPPLKTPPSPQSTIGIDLGIKSFAVTSNGQQFEPNRFLKASLKRLKCLQRRASRKKMGSKNRQKANLHVGKHHEKIANQRADYVHKITTGLIRDNQASSYVIEDLHVAGMIKNRKLSQAIADVSFSEFGRQMEYKSLWYGKTLIVINRFAPSSKRCSDCGHINDDLALSDREWKCGCGVTHDRDLNAAKNIKFFGLNSGTDSSSGPAESRRIRRAKKQEMNN